MYANPEAHIRYGLMLAQKHAMTPSYAIYEPGFVRLGASLHSAYPGAPQPIYRLMFSDHLTFGFPPQEWALEAYLKLLHVEAPGAPWMVAGLGVEIEPLIELAITKGGHFRVGLEDAHHGTKVGNLKRVQEATRQIDRLGGHAASTADIRDALKLP